MRFIKLQIPTQVVLINRTNEVLIKASEKFNLNASLYLEVLKAKGLENKDIQVVNSFNK